MIEIHIIRSNMNSINITKALYYYFQKKGHEIFSHNTLALWQEADFISVNKSDYITECEIKISKSDYKADFTKIHKHKTLQGLTNKRHLTNYFYYACPKDLIKVEEIPEYAGLIYVKEVISGGMSYFIVDKVIKKAPLLHKDKTTDAMKVKLMRSVMYKYFNKLTA